MNKKKWIFTGVAGVVGLGIVAGGAAATASTMNLQTTNGTVIPDGAITERAGVLDSKTVQLRQTNSAVTVVSAPSAANVDTTASAPSPAPSAASAPTAASAPSPAPSPASAPSAASAPSPASAPSAASVASAASD